MGPQTTTSQYKEIHPELQHRQQIMKVLARSTAPWGLSIAPKPQVFFTAKRNKYQHKVQRLHVESPISNQRERDSERERGGERERAFHQFWTSSHAIMSRRHQLPTPTLWSCLSARSRICAKPYQYKHKVHVVRKTARTCEHAHACIDAKAASNYNAKVYPPSHLQMK